MNEGVIKFKIIEFNKTDSISNDLIKDINEIRNILFKLKLIGFNEKANIGYGNISKRLENNKFIITGSKTGNIQQLDNRHYTIVNNVDFDNSSVKCSGHIKPSSESISHAVFYYFNKKINYVIHIHSPLIWNKLIDTDILSTPKEAEFGTHQLSEALIKIVNDNKFKENSVILMRGHEDGIIACGKNSQDALNLTLKLYKKYKQLFLF